MTKPSKVYTVQADNVVSSLEMDINLIPPLVTDVTPYMEKYWRAAWDTGATKSCVTQRIADELKLTQNGKTTFSYRYPAAAEIQLKEI